MLGVTTRFVSLACVWFMPKRIKLAPQTSTLGITHVFGTRQVGAAHHVVMLYNGTLRTHTPLCPPRGVLIVMLCAWFTHKAQHLVSRMCLRACSLLSGTLLRTVLQCVGSWAWIYVWYEVQALLLQGHAEREGCPKASVLQVESIIQFSWQ